MTERKKDGSYSKTSLYCGEIIKLDSLDITFIDTLLSQKCNHYYSPIVICTKTESSSQYLTEKIKNIGMSICKCSAVHSLSAWFHTSIAAICIDEIENDVPLQEQLVNFLDILKETNQVGILIINKSINEMKLLGKLRARLLSGIYTEI